MVWDTEVRNAAAHWGPYYGVSVDPALIHAVIEQESGHGAARNYVAHGGVVPEPDGDFSYGPMQVKGDTVRTVLRLGFPAADLASHPELGIWYGVKEFARRLKAVGGDPAKAVSAWNAGIGGVGRNPAYVRAVLGFWNKYRTAVVSLVPALALAAVAFVLWSRARRRAA
jgi:soluble lytic murein transglycosylase-like protein